MFRKHRGKCTKARKLPTSPPIFSPSAMARLYLSMVRPHLEYMELKSGTHIWPMILGHWRKFGLRVLKEMELKLPGTTCFNYKIRGFIYHCLSYDNSTYYPSSSHPTFLSLSSRYNHESSFKYSFLPNTISLWNNCRLEEIIPKVLPIILFFYSVKLFSQQYSLSLFYYSSKFTKERETFILNLDTQLKT